MSDDQGLVAALRRERDRAVGALVICLLVLLVAAVNSCSGQEIRVGHAYYGDTEQIVGVHEWSWWGLSEKDTRISWRGDPDDVRGWCYRDGNRWIPFWHVMDFEGPGD